MALILWLPVATVNAIIFFLVDTPALAAIHNGLLSLQGYYLLTRARAGQAVSLARSRMPIVGGELLRGTTRWPSVFVLINAGALFCLFFATLGVKADRRYPYVLSSFNFTTTLSEPFNESFFIYPPNNSLENKTSSNVLNNMTCSTRNDTHAHYWSAAFNATLAGSTIYVVGNSISCQAKAPAVHPMLTADCVSDDEEKECFLDAAHLYAVVRQVRVRLQTIRKFSNSEWVEEYVFTDWQKNWTDLRTVTQSDSYNILNQIVGTSGRIFVFQPNDRAVFFFRDYSANDWYFSAGNYVHQNNSGRVQPLLRISFHGTSSMEFLFTSIRTEQEITKYLGLRDFSNPLLFQTTINLFDGIVRLSLRGISLSESVQSYVRMPIKEVTIFDNWAIALYSIVITLALFLLPVKQILFFLLVRSGKVEYCDLFCYEFDQMSKNYRAEQDRITENFLSCEYAHIRRE